MPNFSGRNQPTASLARYYTVAIDSTKTLRGWGKRYDASTAIPLPTLDNVVNVSISAGYGLAVKSDGSVELFGTPEHPQGQENVPSGLTNVVASAVGESHCLALLGDGTVVAWGDTRHGEIDVPAGLSDVQSIAAGTWRSVALKSDGTVAVWGDESYGDIPVPTGLSSVVQLSIADAHVVALKSDGTVVCWGNNGYGQCNVPAGLSGVRKITAGETHSYALLDDGSLVYWGSDYVNSTYQPPAGLTDVAEIYAGYQNTLAIKTNGDVVMWGSNSNDKSTPLYNIEALLPGEMPDVTGTLSANLDLRLSASGTHNPTITGDLLANVGMSFSGIGFKDFVSALSPLSAQKLYSLTITGDIQNPDIAIPISSWQATSQADGRPSYLQCVIPAAEGLINQISARSNGSLVISECYLFADGTERAEEILRASFAEFRYDQGAVRQTATISGYKADQEPQVSATRQLTGVRSVNQTGGKFRVRCAIDLFLRPGMTVKYDGTSFSVGYINYFVNIADSYCEVGER